MKDFCLRRPEGVERRTSTTANKCFAVCCVCCSVRTISHQDGLLNIEERALMGDMYRNHA